MTSEPFCPQVWLHQRHPMGADPAPLLRQVPRTEYTLTISLHLGLEMPPTPQLHTRTCTHTHMRAPLFPAHHNDFPYPTEEQSLFKPSAAQSSPAYFQALVRIPLLPPALSALMVFYSFSFTTLFSLCSWYACSSGPCHSSLLCSPLFHSSFHGSD